MPATITFPCGGSVAPFEQVSERITDYTPQRDPGITASFRYIGGHDCLYMRLCLGTRGLTPGIRHALLLAQRR